METVLGTKSGFLAAVISGIVNCSLIATLLVSNFFKNNFTDIPNKEMLLVTLIVIFLMEIFLGAIAGLLFSISFNNLPADSNIFNGILFSIPFWIMSRFSTAFMKMDDYSSLYLILVHGVIGLIIWLIWGALLGYFWDRFEPKDVDNEI